MPMSCFSFLYRVVFDQELPPLICDLFSWQSVAKDLLIAVYKKSVLLLQDEINFDIISISEFPMDQAESKF